MYEYRLKRKNGQYMWSYHRGRVVEHDEDGNPLRMIGIDTNITQRKQHEEQLRRSQKMDAMGKLTGGIAHDYNNLLSIILGFAELLKMGLPRESKLMDYSENILHAANRGAELTKKLLSFSKHKALNAEMLDINKILRAQQLMLEKTLTVRIQLVLDLADDLWPVSLDHGDLEDAIVNMSINAMHAMDQCGEFTIKTRNEQFDAVNAQQLHLEEGDYVVLSVSDTGCGMSEETIEKIFDPFFTTKGELGSGLGLSQAYGFVERSGGVISVESELGHGTCFNIYFPRIQESHAISPSPATTALTDQRGTETLLVVDDEPVLAELAHDILTCQGYRVLTANDGNQALAILEQEPVDLVISDIIMPIMDGYKLATEIQQRYPHIKIQLVSGYADDRYSCMPEGVLHQTILHKPYISDVLLTRVRTLLNAGNAEDMLSDR